MLFQPRSFRPIFCSGMILSIKVGEGLRSTDDIQ